MANLSALTPVTTTATALSGLILVSPQKTVGYQPQNAPSWKNDTKNAPPPALLFNYEGEQVSTLTADVTDHFIENNTAIQDQVAIRPSMLTVHGFVGELNDIAPAALQPLKLAADKLSSIGAYTPELSATALIAYNEAKLLYDVAATVASSAISTWASINGGANTGTAVINGSNGNAIIDPITGKPLTQNQTKQQIYYQQFYGYFNNRTLFTIQTPWAVFQDMIILSLRAIQEADTRTITDFEITFKQLRFASTSLAKTGLYDNNNFQGRASAQGADQVDQGTTTLKPSTDTFNPAAVA